MYATLWLGLASLVFYGSWNPWFLPVLLISIVLNYGAGRLISRMGKPGCFKRKLVLGVAIAANLLALGYYKYAGFFVHTIDQVMGLGWTLSGIVLPLGISFFTFTQIAYLVDTAIGKSTEENFFRYLLFVSYFPHLIAGPVIHHKDVMPQFANPNAFKFKRENFAVGAGIFIIGLFKKCFFADNVAVYVTPVFDGAGQMSGQALHPLDAWSGVIAYTLQIYYDFSGYSDMAIGLSLMLNVRLPLNFNSPYQARSIIDFWKRWHISLSNFLRDYLYISLGGNRRGAFRRYTNLLITMLIGGFWHGAGWTFIIWGGLHGTYLVINHAWRAMRMRMTLTVTTFEQIFAWGLTMLAVIVAWTFFRAHTLSEAITLLQSMFFVHDQAGLDLFTAPERMQVWLWIIPLSIIAFVAPNSQAVIERFFAGRTPYITTVEGGVWRGPTKAFSIGLGILFGLALMNLLKPAEFLYFNF